MCKFLLCEYPQLRKEIVSAPNRYRKISKDEAAKLQKTDWPDKADRAEGLDMCFMCWDEILVWRSVDVDTVNERVTGSIPVYPAKLPV